MQQNYKIFFFNLYRIFRIYKMFICLTIITITLFLLSGCHFLFQHLKDNILIKENNNIQDQVNKIDNHNLNHFNICKKNNNNFMLTTMASKYVLSNKYILIQKKSNFFKSAHQEGLSSAEIQNVINAIQWQVDFHQLHAGSNFNLVFAYNLLNNKKILLGVKLNNINKKYYSIRAPNGNFYNIHGIHKNECPINVSLLKKYRISSSFNLHRIHPVTHHLSRHLGVDLAMPQGTPVLATSNGKIIKTRFNKIAGFYISLKNKHNYVTRYMHLKKILVKLGDDIKVGQKIALSGNTGRTTGPHLHYEIWFNKRPINPMKLKCIISDTMTEQEKQIYFKLSKKILKYLG